MAQYYLNAESAIQNGLTPETGYHNFTDLINNYDLTESDFVDIVKTTTPITQYETVTLAGIIREQTTTPATYPEVVTSANVRLLFQSNSFFIGIKHTSETLVHTLPLYDNAPGASNSTIDKCIIFANIDGSQKEIPTGDQVFIETASSWLM